MGIYIREDCVDPGAKDKKVCRPKENYPLPQPQHTKPYFFLMTSYLTLTWLQLTLQGALVLGGQNEPGFRFMSRFSLASTALPF